jgi:hypothetical protein
MRFVEREGVGGFEPNMHVRFGRRLLRTEPSYSLMVTYEVKKIWLN